MNKRKRKNSLLSPALQSRLIISCFIFIALLLSISISEEDLQTRWILSALLLGMNIYTAKALALHLTYKRSKRIRTWSLIEKLRLSIYLFVTVLTMGASASWEVYSLYSIALGLLLVHKYSDTLFSKSKDGFETLAMNEIDQMSGTEFEQFVSKLYEGLGYSTQLTPLTGDYGADILTVKKKVKTAIQTKCYGKDKKVGVNAINEVLGGAGYWKANRKVVLTNRSFSNSAIKSAQRNDVTLIDREGLQILLDQYKKEIDRGRNKRRFPLQKRSGK
ncbi:restriction endonuclease [Pontibacillus chungwhensis BH030062]|uniref:Restriction endonuclease n=1 Tax=Pontibacillus chungwhensis BH030062 TaxID=1385513 RepID=A0A0A2UQH1_9BACI|nr:restriction endonuclease [Pontibacillus chungwhensis]KGP90542.1 restriction endonuclease [Pontibacillus chungwhensis BH030062]